MHYFCKARPSISAGYLGLVATVLGLAVAMLPAQALDFQSSRTLSLGQTGRGGALLNDTIFLNPSLLGFQPLVSISGTYDWVTNSVPEDPTKSHIYNASVIDGKNEYVNAGLSFTRRSGADLLDVSLAKRVLPYASIGLSGKRYSTNSNAVSLLNGMPISGRTGFDGSLSAAFLIPNSLFETPLQLGLLFDNLAGHQKNEDVFGARQAGAGLKANLANILVLYADMVEFFPKAIKPYPMFYGATELGLSREIFLRAGVFGQREKGWGVGAGWVGPRTGINYGYQIKRADSVKMYQHAVTVDVYM